MQKTDIPETLPDHLTANDPQTTNREARRRAAAINRRADQRRARGVDLDGGEASDSDPPWPRWLRAPEAAAYTGYAEATLAKWRHFGTGPAYSVAARVVLYDRRDLDEWIEAHKVRSTSEAAS